MPVQPEEKRVIDGLFGKLSTVERQAPPRDPDAERLIAERMSAQPGAAYYMAQTIVAQEHALEHAQRRIAELESSARTQPSGGGGFLSSLFGGGQPSRAPAHRAPAHGQGMGALAPGHGGPWGGRSHGRDQGAFGMSGRGGGFLAGAAQTAVGVAGGVVLGNLIMDAFTTDASEVAAGATDAVDQAGGAVDQAGEQFGDFGLGGGDGGGDSGGGDSGGGDLGGDFGGGEF